MESKLTLPEVSKEELLSAFFLYVKDHDAENRNIGDSLHHEICSDLLAASLMLQSFAKKRKDQIGDLEDLTQISELLRNSTTLLRSNFEKLYNAIADFHGLDLGLASYLNSNKSRYRCSYENLSEINLRPFYSLYYQSVIFKLITEIAEYLVDVSGTKALETTLFDEPGLLCVFFGLDNDSNFTNTEISTLDPNSLPSRLNLIKAKLLLLNIGVTGDWKSYLKIGIPINPTNNFEKQ